MDLVNEFDSKKLARINELAKIAKERALTSKEESERAQLRKEFLDNFRAGFKQQMDNIKVVHPEDLNQKKPVYTGFFVGLITIRV